MLIIYQFGILVSKICVVIIIITCLGLAVASWLQPEDDSAVSMAMMEEIVGFVWLGTLALRSTSARLNKGGRNSEVSSRHRVRELGIKLDPGHSCVREWAGRGHHQDMPALDQSYSA